MNPQNWHLPDIAYLFTSLTLFHLLQMAQINKGIRSILSIPFFYTFFQKVVGADYSCKTFINNYVRPNLGDRILDIGCGPADVLAYLPQVEYIGFDANEKYINTAKKRYGSKGRFVCELVKTTNLPYESYFNIVLVMGILHHLDDSEAQHLFEIAHRTLESGGRLIAIEPCFTENQSPCARWIISKDRGQNVRNQQGYLQLAHNLFENTSYNIRQDLLRIPYTHIILECTKS